jgi:hypothetical protein
MQIEIPSDVMNAIVAFVAMQRSFDPDLDGWLVEHYPILCEWLEGLGLLPPGDDENLEATNG